MPDSESSPRRLNAEEKLPLLQQRPAGPRQRSVPMSRREDILFDRNLLIAERKRLLEAMAVMQRRVDKIE